MVNLQTPPPSYEEVTGISGAQSNQTNQFFSNALPSATPQPAGRPTVYQANRLINIPEMGRQESNTMAACYMLTIICILVVVLIVPWFTRKSSPTKSVDFDEAWKGDYHPEMLNSLEQLRYKT